MDLTYKGLLLLLLSSFYISESDNKYVIGSWPGGGLGVCMISVLQHLAYCEKEGKIPVVYWDKKSFYYNPSGFNGEGANVWQYYFEPVSAFKYNAGDVVHACCGSHASCGKFYSLNLDNKAMRDEANFFYKKYIKPKAIVQKKVDQFYAENIAGKHTIGIHLRGTDILPKIKGVDIKKIADEALKHAHEDTQFFIASDDLNLFNQLCAQLKGRKIVYYPCYKAGDNKPLHYKGGSKPSYAQAGEDVLVEMLLLAQCDYVVLMQSNISSVVLIMNNNVNYRYFMHPELATR